VNPALAPLQPYLLWIKLGVAVIIVGGIFWAGWSVCDWRWQAKENADKQALIDKHAAELKEWEDERRRWETASTITATQLATMETQKDALLATLNGLKLTRTIKVEPNAQGECESAVLDDAFRLRWNAVVDQAGPGAAADRRR
jgi:hypothetical protein